MEERLELLRRRLDWAVDIKREAHGKRRHLRALRACIRICEEIRLLKIKMEIG